MTASFQHVYRPWLEDLLEAGYLTMIYSGATDIICHHTGNVAMLQDLDWSGTAAYLEADNEVTDNFMLKMFFMVISQVF